MDRRIKHIFRDILKEENSELCFGDFVASQYFKEGRCALIIDENTNSCQILLQDIRQAPKTILSLTELLGVMTQLEKDASIILLDNTIIGGINLFYEGKLDFAESILPGRYQLSSTSYLSYTPGKTAQIDEKLFGISVPEPLVNSFIRLFSSKVFPTAALARFVKQGFMSDAQYDTMRALRLSRIAILVAILLGLYPLIEHNDKEDVRGKNQIEEVHSQDTLNNSR